MKEIQQDILDYIRERREANITELGYHLGLGSTGAREHITLLERDGLVRNREQRDAVGRPTIRYQLSDSGEAVCPKQYDQLASALLESLSDDARWDELLEQAGERLARADAAVAEPIGTSAQKRVEAACHELRAKNVVADGENSDAKWARFNRLVSSGVLGS